MEAIIGYILAIVVITTMVSLGSNIKRDREIKARIERGWGNEIEEKYSEDDLKTIAEYFNNRRKGVLY